FCCDPIWGCYNDEEYEELYKDVNVRLKDVKHKEEGKGDAEMIDAGRDDELSYKQVDYSTQLLETIKSEIPAMIDAQLSIRLKDSIQKAFRSDTTKFKKKAQCEKKRYIDLIEKSVKDIIKDEVKSLLLQILPKEVSDYATLKDLKDKDKDEDPLAGSDQGLKRRKTSKDAELSKGSKSKE
nr:hypothetical protein [Tanacetum cinerariifolium]